MKCNYSLVSGSCGYVYFLVNVCKWCFGDDVNVAKAVAGRPLFMLSWPLRVARLQRKLQACRDFFLAFPPSAEWMHGMWQLLWWLPCENEYPVQFQHLQHMQSSLSTILDSVCWQMFSEQRAYRTFLLASYHWSTFLVYCLGLNLNPGVI